MKKNILAFIALILAFVLSLGIRFYAISGMHKDLKQLRETMEGIREDERKFREEFSGTKLQ